MPEGDRFCGRCGLARSKDGKPVDPLIGITVAGRYRIERRIGVGGMGTVYLGTHVRIGQKVAIKVLHERYAGDEQLTKRFEKEALTYGQVTHPNLVGLHDYGRTEDGTFFMVLEYCPGISLAQLVRRRGSLEHRLAVDILIQIAQGLGAAHAMGIVHRDLKPENVILTRTRPGRYHARLLDFGIAKRLDDDGPRLTAAGMVFGTPEYMAPEQARGKPVDARSDIYALGCVAYELMTGNPPFIGNDKLRIMHQQAGDPIDPPSSKLPEGAPAIPDVLEAVAMRCLAKPAGDRYADTETLIEALERALDPDLRRPPATVEAPEVLSSEPIEPTAPESPSARTGRRSTAAAARTEGSGPVGMGTLPDRVPSDRFSEIIIDGLPTDIGLRGTRPGPSPRALGAAAAVFVGVLAFSGWLFSAGEEAPPVAQDTAQPAVRAQVAAAIERMKSDALVRQTELMAQRAAAEAEQQAKLDAERAAKATAEKQARAAAEKKARADAAAQAKAAAAAKARAEAAARKKAAAEAKRIAEKQRREEAARVAALAAAQKALRLGRLEDAEAAARKLDAQRPDSKDVNQLVDQIDTVRTALATGRTAFEGADCVKALAALEPVLDIAPGARGVSHMVNSCRNSLPPRQL